MSRRLHALDVGPGPGRELIHATGLRLAGAELGAPAADVVDGATDPDRACGAVRRLDGEHGPHTTHSCRRSLGGAKATKGLKPDDLPDGVVTDDADHFLVRNERGEEIVAERCLLSLTVGQ